MNMILYAQFAHRLMFQCQAFSSCKFAVRTIKCVCFGFVFNSITDRSDKNRRIKMGAQIYMCLLCIVGLTCGKMNTAKHSG